MKAIDMTGMTVREPTAEDVLDLLTEFKRITYLNTGDEAQRLAHILWQEGFVIIEHKELEPLMSAERFLGIKKTICAKD